MKLIIAACIFAIIGAVNPFFLTRAEAADMTPPNERSGKAKPEVPTGAVIGPQSALDFTVRSIDGELVNLSKYKGKTVLIVNVASRCGFTPQYKALQGLYEKYQAKGLVILGFPSNDFGGQEPGSNAEIKKFCQSKYQVTFPLFEKGSVTGDAKQPLYQFLTEKSGVEFQKPVDWNFVKYLVSPKGDVVGRFSSRVAPDDKEFIAKIEKQLQP